MSKLDFFFFQREELGSNLYSNNSYFFKRIKIGTNGFGKKEKNYNIGHV